MTRPRKGVPYAPELPILVRDAMPLASELADPDPTATRETERRRDIARDILIGLYRDAERQGTLDRLDPSARLICEELKKANGGRLPGRKGGRPEDKHFRLVIWLRVRDAIEGGARVGAAIRKVAAELEPPRTNTHVRDIWFDRSAEWTRWTKATLGVGPRRPGHARSDKDLPRES